MSQGESDSPKVGYRRPPQHSRFKAGRSGNPRGRPKGSKNFSTVLLETVREKVVVTEDGRRKHITKLEAMVKQLANKAASGDPRATQLLTQMVQASEGRSAEANREVAIESTDELIIQQLVTRIKSMVTPDDTNESG